MSITVKVIRVPGSVKEVGLSDGATVSDALNEVGTSVAEGEALQVNGATVAMDHVLSDGASIVIAKGAKGAKNTSALA